MTFSVNGQDVKGAMLGILLPQRCDTVQAHVVPRKRDSTSGNGGRPAGLDSREPIIELCAQLAGIRG